MFLFRTILLFCSKLAREFFCAMLGKFVQVGAAFAAAGYYQKINRFKIKIAEKWFRSDDMGFFLCNVVWSLLGNIAWSFCVCNVLPRVLRHYWTGFVHVKCFLEALGQHCARFLPVQCCPKTIKTTLNMIYSWVMFCGGSWTTFHKIFTCVMLPKSIRQHWTGSFSVLCSIAPDFYLCNVVPIVLRQHWTVLFSV